MSAAFPNIKPQYACVSPLLAEAVNENLGNFTKINKTVLDLIQEVAAIHEKASSSIMTVVETFKRKISDGAKAKPQYQSESYEKFINRLLDQMESQAKVLQTVSGSFHECVIAPVRETMEKKKDVWKRCFFYVKSFQQQIKQKEEDLLKRYKDCSDAAHKIKPSFDEKGNNKQMLMYHNSHNTYLLRLSSVNSINKLMYTHVLPYVLHSIEQNQAEINDSLRHHIKYMFTVQKESLKKIIKSVDKIDHATERIDLVGDLHKFIKSMKGQVKDKAPPQHEFTSPCSVQGRQTSIFAEPLQETFVINRYTQPNLQRRLVALQSQTNTLIDDIASLRAGENKEESHPGAKQKDQALEDLIELLTICDKEANLNVLLRQMELYTPEITEFLGQCTDNVKLESKSKKKSLTPLIQKTQVTANTQNPHKFTELRSVKPLHCFYCRKLVTTFSKGYVCKSCKMPVHKKCATNVPFCDGGEIKVRSGSITSETSDMSTEQEATECAEVYDLIDLESDDDYQYYDDDEFDDGLSDEEVYDIPEQQPSFSSNKLLSPAKSLPNPLSPIKSVTPQSMETAPPPLPYKPPLAVSPSNHGTNNASKPALSAKPLLAAKPAMAKKPVVTAKPPSLKPSLPAKNQEMQGSKHKKHVALYDYKSIQPSELSFTAGSIVEVFDTNDNDWWKGTCNRFEGYFPRTYVMEISPGDQILRTIYPFTAQDPKELTVIKGEILILLQQEDDWVNAMSVDSKGLVPASYVEYI